MDDLMEDVPESQTLANETPPNDVFLAPSITRSLILSGESYTYQSPTPKTIQNDMTTPCALGVDEAGRGPVLGPMVYGLLYLPLPLHHSLLAETHHFDDSKVLTPAVRSDLMEKICTKETDLYENCGWANDERARYFRCAATAERSVQSQCASDGRDGRFDPGRSGLGRECHGGVY
jgi:ribonuclease H2 subunit A